MKLHLGCGRRDFPGWINVDLDDYPHIHHKQPIFPLQMFEANVASCIDASHAFEYFDNETAPLVLNDWRRVLKPGGTLRLAVPDFKALISVYEKTEKISDIIGPLFGRMKISSNEIIFHKTVYDFESLGSLLVSQGFVNIRRYDWRNTEHAEYDDHSQAYFPHMDKNFGIHVSLNVEAEKPD